QPGRDLLGVDPVVLGLGAVDGAPLQGVAQDEGDLVWGAGVGEPVPGDDALAGDDQSVLGGGDSVEDGGGWCGEVLGEEDGALRVVDAEVHRPGMTIDAAGGSVLDLVESHHGPPFEVLSHLPSLWQKGCRRLGGGHDEYQSVA